jgi:hypothetical protein
MFLMHFLFSVFCNSCNTFSLKLSIVFELNFEKEPCNRTSALGGMGGEEDLNQAK